MIRAFAVLAVAGAAVAALGGDASPSTAIPVDGRSGPALMADVVARIYGSPEQRAAGWEAQHYVMQAAYAACAERKGIDDAVDDWTPPSGVFETGAVDLPWLFAPAMTDFGIARRYLEGAGFQDGPAPRMTDAERRRIARFGECQMELASMDGRPRPSGRDTLEQEFLDDQATIRHEWEPRLIGWYSTCMTHVAGMPVDSFSDAHRQVELKFQAVVHRVPNGPGWSEAVALEKRVAAADGLCRKANADALATASEPVVKEFADRHRAELAAVAAEWAAMPAARDAAKKAVAK
ncbi:hypothetical protein KOI35_40770 [Actinoplanes bogorensis]|uniref:Uncharacterized protein n=1 Tax=Paractinoplanes bogorensis TaxID=1610840 RepID=A0ABS5Z2I0_9ACTN|nr:hypothetical protein [Actinoplanes bogorensis]MBU2669863.1 hypothetical protein [Actinoplanes bogorensis]